MKPTANPFHNYRIFPLWDHPWGNVSPGRGVVKSIQLGAQIGTLLLLFERPDDVKNRHLLFLLFASAQICSLYLLKAPPEILVFSIVIFLIIVMVLPLDAGGLRILFMILLFERTLAQWGFFFVFQVLILIVINAFCRKDKFFPWVKFSSFLFITLVFFCVGNIFYGKNYVANPWQLSTIISGSTIPFLSLRPRTVAQKGIGLTIYFLLTCALALFHSPNEVEGSINVGLVAFLGLHLAALVGISLFYSILPDRKDALVPLILSGIFTMVPYLPEIGWLTRWIEGLNLLLLLLGLYNLCQKEDRDSGVAEQKEGDVKNRSSKPFNTNKSCSKEVPLTKS